MARDESDACDAGRRRFLQLAAAGMALLMSRGSADTPSRVALYADETLGRYGFGGGHPFGPDRQAAFLAAAAADNLLDRVQTYVGRLATEEELTRFHTPGYVEEVKTAESDGRTYLDAGDTPVFPDVYRVSAHVVGAALEAAGRIMNGSCLRSFQPIGGLHHAARARASGFCVFNDLGVLIETLRSVHGVRRVAYIDIDVHHGDGVYYAFESDPDLIFADIHQHSRTLFPGTGRADERGRGAAEGTKLNIELLPGADDAEFMRAWKDVEAHLERLEPEFIILQCGADSLGGDPLASLAYTPAAHAHAARSLCRIAARHAGGRVMAFGGGGYNRRNLGLAWSAVLRELIEADERA